MKRTRLHVSAWDKGKTHIIFVRHAHRLPMSGISHPGPALSPKGKKQAHELTQAILPLAHDIDVVYASTMTRAKQTIAPLAKTLKKQVTYTDALCEVDNSVYKKNRKQEEKVDEAMRFLEQVLTEHKGKTILIVSHGTLIKALLAQFLQIPYEIAQHYDIINCGISRFRFLGTRFDYLYYWNSQTLW